MNFEMEEGCAFWKLSREQGVMVGNKQVVEQVYKAAEGSNLDVGKFVSLFADDGYFLDETSGSRWQGREVGGPIKSIVGTFPDMHREIITMYASESRVIVELKLQGTHVNDWITKSGTLRATGKRFDVPCCDVFSLRDSRVSSFYCYNKFSAWVEQLGGFDLLVKAAGST